MRSARPLIAAAAFVLLLCLSGSEPALLFLAPILCVFAPLLAGRYPGERLIRRLGRWRLPQPVPAFPLHRPRARIRFLPRGGGLLACALAGRAPPGMAGTAA